MERIVPHPQYKEYNESSQAYDFALLQMDSPIHHLSIQIYEDSLNDNHDHEDDHKGVVSLFGYVTGKLSTLFIPYCKCVKLLVHYKVVHKQ